MKYQLLPNNLKFVYIAILTIGLGLAGCSVNDSDPADPNEITEEDLEIAAEIMGEELSGDNSGYIGSLYDASADIGSDGMGFDAPGTGLEAPGPVPTDQESGRGGEQNWSYSYDPETGIHTVEFSRSVFRGESSKEVSTTYEYIFKDTDGDFIEHPRVDKDSVATEDFFGSKTGTISTPNLESNFSRTDTAYFVGLESDSDFVTINGTHHGEGDRTITRGGEIITTSYIVDAEVLDVQVDKEVVLANENLEEGVTGTIEYTLELTRTKDDVQSTVTIEGTVVMNGDGSALLRFKDFGKFFIVDLTRGDVTEG